MSTLITIFTILFILAIVLIFVTMIFSWLKSLQRSRFQKWTFLDYVSVGYLKHLYIKYIKRG